MEHWLMQLLQVSSEKPISQQLQRPVQQPVQQPIQQQHHLQLVQPNFGAYRGQSLPNVNKVANNSIDLQVGRGICSSLIASVFGRVQDNRGNRYRNFHHWLKLCRNWNDIQHSRFLPYILWWGLLRGWSMIASEFQKTHSSWQYLTWRCLIWW